MSLRTLQRDLVAALLDGAPAPRVHLVGTPQASALSRLGIYARAYRLRLLEALAEDYAGLAAWLGAAQFETLVHAYIDRHPSRHPSLRWLGRHLAGFLAGTPPWSAQPWLAEMAAFEWAQGEVFDAPDSPVAPPHAIAAVPPAAWPHLRLQAHPSLRRLDLHWNIPVIWRALDEDAAPPPPVDSVTAQAWVLWRRDLAIHWRSLDAAEAGAIDAWRSGADLAGVCDVLCDHLDGALVAERAAGLLKGWLDAGLVSTLRTG